MQGEACAVMFAMLTATEQALKHSLAGLVLS